MESVGEKKSVSNREWQLTETRKRSGTQGAWKEKDIVV